jgi:hypothetical protein
MNRLSELLLPIGAANQMSLASAQTQFFRALVIGDQFSHLRAGAFEEQRVRQSATRRLRANRKAKARFVARLLYFTACRDLRSTQQSPARAPRLDAGASVP